MTNQLFKITWRLPYVQYETFIAALNEDEALNIFKREILKDAGKQILSIEVVEFSGVIVTKKI